MIGWIVVAAIIAFILGFDYGVKDSKHENEQLKADNEKKDALINYLTKGSRLDANG